MKKIKHQGRIIRFSIDLTSLSGYVDGEHDEAIYKALTRKELYKEDKLYTVVDGERIEELVKNGTYRLGKDTIFAFKKTELTWRTEDYSNCIYHYAKKYREIALAVWDANKFEPHYPRYDNGEALNWEYKFKNPTDKKSALLAVIQLKE